MKKLERSTCTTWYKCVKCGEIKHGENFYSLPNGAKTAECVKCYDKYITQQTLCGSEAKASTPKVTSWPSHSVKRYIKFNFFGG